MIEDEPKREPKPAAEAAKDVLDYILMLKHDDKPVLNPIFAAPILSHLLADQIRRINENDDAFCPGCSKTAAHGVYHQVPACKV